MALNGVVSSAHYILVLKRCSAGIAARIPAVLIEVFCGVFSVHTDQCKIMTPFSSEFLSPFVLSRNVKVIQNY